MVLKDLLAVLFDHGDDDSVGAEFPKMMDLCVEMFRDVNRGLWNGHISEELRKTTYEKDIVINQSERSIRKKVLTHLATSDSPRDINYCFVLSNVVKDAERIGDYIKNLAEIDILDTSTVPDEPLRKRVEEMGRNTEDLLARVDDAFQNSDERKAEELVRQGRELAEQCEELVRAIAESGYSSKATACLVLIARFYKRIIAHATNILSSVIMPPHKIDFFDEDELKA